MKKNIIKVALVAVVGLIAGINVFNAQKAEVLSDVAMANVEALAQTETNTTWRCSGFWGDCYALCGSCNTQVGPSNGELSGTHSCKTN